ncbi:DUF2987 domain-containing protein [Pseudoalteromonas xiamenensis]|uniref:DUF2987 domain-containing protein n=1 Tax=Pseudoalteromonas xiamenensis TaxID=882626 RepID=UPI0035EF8BE9
MKSSIIGLSLMVLAPIANASEFVVSYDGFYDRLKVMDKGQYEYAQINFYLVDSATLKPCEIKSGKLITENNSLPLSYTENAQLLLPLDKQLDADKAVIVVEPQNPAHECQLKMQIEAPSIKLKQLNTAVVKQVNDEFDDLLTNLSGFFIGKLLSFLLPSQKGIQIEFEDEVDIPGALCESKTCKISMENNFDSNALKNAEVEIKNIVPWIAN